MKNLILRPGKLKSMKNQQQKRIRIILAFKYNKHKDGNRVIYRLP